MNASILSFLAHLSGRCDFPRMSWDEFVALPNTPNHPLLTRDIRFPTSPDPFPNLLYSYGTPGAAHNEHLELLMRALTVNTIFPGSDPFYNAYTNMSFHDYAIRVANRPVGLNDGMKQRILWGPGGGMFYAEIVPKARQWYNCSHLDKADMKLSLVAGYIPQYAGTNFHHHPPVANVLLRGRKLWLMYPPHMGAFVKAEVPEMQPPLHTLLHLMHRPHLPRPLVCVAESNTLTLVPEGWWHATVNLEKTLGVGCTSY
jgi:hypothetical protein